MMHKFDALTTQQVKKTHHRPLEREQPHSHSPGAVPSLNTSGSGSSGYKSLSPGSVEAFEEVFDHGEVIPSEQLPVLSEWVEVRFWFKLHQYFLVFSVFVLGCMVCNVKVEEPRETEKHIDMVSKQVMIFMIAAEISRIRRKLSALKMVVYTLAAHH